MDSTKSFAKALYEGFRSPAMVKRHEELNRPAFVVGDGTDVVLGDYVRIPDHVGGRRAGEWGEVVLLDGDGLGIRFKEKVAGITREFFGWEDLRDARAAAVSRVRKRLSVTPPQASK